jgi:hypothetical protein
MKKNYIKPEVMIVEVKQTQMLAASTPNEAPVYYDDTTDDQW